MLPVRRRGHRLDHMDRFVKTFIDRPVERSESAFDPRFLHLKGPIGYQIVDLLVRYVASPRFAVVVQIGVEHIVRGPVLIDPLL